VVDLLKPGSAGSLPNILQVRESGSITAIGHPATCALPGHGQQPPWPTPCRGKLLLSATPSEPTRAKQRDASHSHSRVPLGQFSCLAASQSRQPGDSSLSYTINKPRKGATRQLSVSRLESKHPNYRPFSFMYSEADPLSERIALQSGSPSERIALRADHSQSGSLSERISSQSGSALRADRLRVEAEGTPAAVGVPKLLSLRRRPARRHSWRALQRCTHHCCPEFAPLEAAATSKGGGRRPGSK